MKRFCALVLAFALAGAAQEPDSKQKIKQAKELAKGGSESIAQLRPMLSDATNEVREAAVDAIATIGTQHSLDPLLQAIRDNDAEIQMLATDGLVNFYLPGYLQSGFDKFRSTVRNKLDKENTQAIPPYVAVREDVVVALGKVARGGTSMESRANAARALGILRGKAAVPDLVEAIRSKDDKIIYESLIALQKIRDESAGPRIQFLLRDLTDRVQIAAIETTGLLRNKQAVPELQKVYNSARNDKVRRAALFALAMLPDASSRSYFQKAFIDKNDAVRAAAAEGFGRLKSPPDAAMMEKTFTDEKKMQVRLAQAFALVNLGRREISEFSALQYLINTLNSRQWRNTAEAYLMELTRDPDVRMAIYPAVGRGTKEEKLGLGRVLSVSGDKGSVQYLEALTKDSDADVAQESLRALRSLKARVL